MSELNLDLLDTSKITDLLNESSNDCSFFRQLNPCIYKELDSTNAELKRRVVSGDYSSLLIIADKQTAGRGRLGRSFESPKDTGIYMSLLLPNVNSNNILLITSAAAVAVCRGIRNISDLTPTIKWVNDIYSDNKKVCGILAEAVTSPSGSMDVILGIGINVTTAPASFSDEIRILAGSLFNNRCDAKISRNTVISSVVREFYGIYEHIEDREYLNDYRRWSNVIGRKIAYRENNIWHEATAIDIDNNGGLIVESDNNKHVLSTGEISVRLPNNPL
ncbi:MAG: biotin--[acetyl-CoA-carboxylase] ligase [Lachnospiraceae bacterium]|nr:biotin--[acetyl-CoA-carboxylase] ligase [Lachnospiraceae bacterium]